ncbi:MAG: SusC/RagA family TonB-linked outer membrane protein [Microscillaceae bacterium]
MKQKLLLVLFLVLATVATAFAQTRTVKGRVTDAETGEGVPGVSVFVKGTTTGTVTDINGNYEISVSEGAILVFQAVGMRTTEQTVGAQGTIDLAMAKDTTELGEVVVTAVGIEREKKALGYAVSTVASEQIEQKTEGDIGRLLRGKASGVNVTQTNGVSGSGTNIIIRGYTSINGSNQPLFVVDGVPFDGGANQQSNFVDGQTESSRFLDLDPNNIESVNVLKGLNATVLYGDRGRNGVILITTKSGSKNKDLKKKTEISITQSLFANEIASLPDFQDNYGSGFYNSYGPFFSNWGPSFSELQVVPHPYGNFADPLTQSAFPQFVGADYAYRAYDNEEFFETGIISTTTIGIRGGSEKVNFSASYSYYDDKGFTPNNQLKRNTLSFGGNASLSNNFVLAATINYTNTDYTTPPIAASLGSSVTGDGASIFGDVFYTPRNIDLMGLPYQNPLTGASVYYRAGNDIQNPRWTAENARSAQKVDRVFGQMSLTYNFKDWLSVLYRAGLDVYAEDNEYFQNRGGVDGNINGILRTTTAINRIINTDLIITVNKNLNDDFGLSALVGFNTRRDVFTRQGIESTQQEVFGVDRHFAFKNQSAFNSFSGGQLQLLFEENRLGLYGQVSVDYKDFLFLNLTGRNDWSNTLETGNNSLFYTGVSLAADLTTAIDALKGSDIINFLKLRVGYGSSANFPGPYNTRNTLGISTRAFQIGGQSVPISTNAVANQLGNPDLKPERLDEIEVGIETRWWKNRISAELSLYSKITNDLLLDRDLDPSTGFTGITQNAGKVRVQGLEFDYNALLLDKSGFQWRVFGNFQLLRSEVLELPDDSDGIVYAGFTNLGNFAIEGQPLGIIQGSFVPRDPQGRRIVNSDGSYLESSVIDIIADPYADWTSTISTTLSWKGITFSMEWQYQQGGDLVSYTAGTLLARGISSDTDFDRRQTFVLPGVQEVADGVFEENTVQIAVTDLYFNNYGFGADEFRVYDATHLRLNEVSLSYNLPSKILSKTPFGSVQLTLSGYNMWYEAFNFPDGTNVDPNVNGLGVGNGQGFEFLNGPSSRRYGGSIKITF